MARIPSHYVEFMQKNPEIGDAYQKLGEATLDSGPLTRKQAELVKIGISLGACLESAVRSHCRKAIEAGATEQEVRHAVMLAVTTVGFPTMMAGLRWVEEAMAG